MRVISVTKDGNTILELNKGEMRTIVGLDEPPKDVCTLTIRPLWSRVAVMQDWEYKVDASARELQEALNRVNSVKEVFRTPLIP